MVKKKLNEFVKNFLILKFNKKLFKIEKCIKLVNFINIFNNFL